MDAGSLSTAPVLAPAGHSPQLSLMPLPEYMRVSQSLSEFTREIKDQFAEHRRDIKEQFAEHRRELAEHIRELRSELADQGRATSLHFKALEDNRKVGRSCVVCFSVPCLSSVWVFISLSLCRLAGLLFLHIRPFPSLRLSLLLCSP